MRYRYWDDFSRAERPPLRCFRREARVGKSVMISARSSFGILDQREISSMVLKQPVQMRSFGWTTQMLMQGLSISARFQTGGLVSLFTIASLCAP